MEKDFRMMNDEEQRIYVRNHPLYLILNPDIALHQSKLKRSKEVFEILEACKNQKSVKQIEEEKKKIYEQYNSDEEDEHIVEERCKKIAMLEYGNISRQELEDLCNEKEQLMYWIVNPKNHAIVSAKNREAAFERTKDRILKDLKEQDKQKAIEMKEEAKKKKLELQLRVLQLKAEAMQ